MHKYFEGDAFRDERTGKLDPEAALCPQCVRMYCEYIAKNRKIKDGQLRPDDNWQAGFPVKTTVKSLLRHAHDVWLILRGFPPVDPEHNLDDALLGTWFNAQSILHDGHKKQ